MIAERVIAAERVQSLLAERRRGFSLPQAFYSDNELHEADLDAIFGAQWIFACNACEIRRPGDYLTMEVGRDSIVILRDREGEVRAFHNVCRHRGSRLCLTEKGRANRLVCPYHQWVYELDGSLRNARQMLEDFDRSAYGLKPAHVRVICGMVHICLADQAPSLDAYARAISPYIAPHQPERTKVAHEATIVEEANWKLVIENNRECYHCAANHPELLATFLEMPLRHEAPEAAPVLDYVRGKTAKWQGYGLPHEAADGGDEFRCVRLPFLEGAVSFTSDGAPACTRLLGELTDPDLGSVRIFRAPNNWNHFLSDHIIHFRVLPLAAGRTALRTTWLVHEEAVEGVDYEVERLIEVWTATNAQDAHLASINHRGVASRAYQPGPYAPSEFMLTQFTDWYAERMADHFGRPSAMRVAAE